MQKFAFTGLSDPSFVQYQMLDSLYYLACVCAYIAASCTVLSFLEAFLTTVQTRSRQIAEIEGFDIVVTKDGAPVDPKQNGVLGAYDYRKALKHTKTVADWRGERFQSSYPGFSCDVLLEDGTVAAGQTSLRTVRESYEAD